LSFSTGPVDLPPPAPSCLGWQLNNFNLLSLVNYLSSHGGDPIPEFAVEALRANHITPTSALEKAVAGYLAERKQTLAGTILLPPNGTLRVLAPGHPIVSAVR
jgi:hypothetical protein